MKELLERLSPLLEDHLRKIVSEVESNGGFRCPQQLHDVREVLSAMKKAKELSAMA